MRGKPCANFAAAAGRCSGERPGNFCGLRWPLAAQCVEDSGSLRCMPGANIKSCDIGERARRQCRIGDGKFQHFQGAISATEAEFHSCKRDCLLRPGEHHLSCAVAPLSRSRGVADREEYLRSQHRVCLQKARSHRT
jgi:hypothetical protein